CTLDDNASTNARTDCHIDHILVATTRAKHVFAQPCCIGIILNVDGDVIVLCKDVAQRHMIPTREILWSKNNTGLAIQWPWRGYANAGYLLKRGIGPLQCFSYGCIQTWNNAIGYGIFACQQAYP